MKRRTKRILDSLSITLLFLLISGVLCSCQFVLEDGFDIDETQLSNVSNNSAPVSYLNEPLDGPYPVEYVIDGDTIIVTIDGESVHVRLIGIDTPECASHDESRNTEEGVIARERMVELIEDTNNEVYLEYDVERYDNYGRLLAYVYVEDLSHQYSASDYSMLEEVMLGEGYGDILTIEPNNRYATFFEEIA